jgi:hypothetical protein
VDPEAGFDIERRLRGLARSSGPVRAALAEIACAFVYRRAWERLDYARLSDYADERVGRSARSLQDLARVGHMLHRLPRLRDALASGRLGWTKTRLLARAAKREDEERWIAYALRVTSVALAREVRRVDRGSLEAHALDRDESCSRWFEVPCTPEVYARWRFALVVARRVHGGRLGVSESAEMIAAEVLSALPLDPDVLGSEADCSAGLDGASWARAASEREESRTDSCALEEATLDEPSPPDDVPAGSGDTVPTGADGEEAAPPRPAALDALLRDLDTAGAFELDRRLCAVVEMERALDARIGPLLDLVARRRIHVALGFPTLEAYARERLGLDPSWARALLRIEYAARMSPAFAQAYRRGALTALQARTLLPVVLEELSEGATAAWIARARRFTLRRLRDDVERALLVRETDFEGWLRTGGLPEEGEGGEDREIGAPASGLEEGAAGNEASGMGQEIGAQPSEPQNGDGHGVVDETPLGAWEIGARKSAPRETCLARAILDVEVARLVRGVLCTVRRRIERVTGRLPTEGEALGAMLDHVLEAWGALDEKLRRSHPVFARDGWRCVVPGCTSMRNLHDHHIVFRSAGGSDELANRVTLCAFHHLRGVHAGTIRLTGAAPNRLRIAIGVRPDGPPLALYGSGDRLLRPGAS